MKGAMETLTECADRRERAADDVLCLPFERRQKTRQRARLQSGREVAVILPRGIVMRGGYCLGAESGLVVLIESALEAVSVVNCDDPTSLARAAYHLGNRHISVEVGELSLSYLQDHVLDDMVRGFDLAVSHELRPFEPEAGAYDAQGHSHGSESLDRLDDYPESGHG